MLSNCMVGYMDVVEKPKLIIFGKFSSLSNRYMTLSLGCWLKGVYYKRAKGQINDGSCFRQDNDKADDKLHLLYVFDYRLVKHELILLRFKIVKSIDRNGDFITQHN